jgi:hypothetical protein
MSHDSEPWFQEQLTATGPSSLFGDDWDLYTSIHDYDNDSMTEEMGTLLDLNDIIPHFDPLEPQYQAP